MSKITVQVELDITDQDIDDIVATAFEGGIDYWCSEVRAENAVTREYLSDEISAGNTLVILTEDEEEFKLTKANFLNGLTQYISQGNYIFAEGSLDTCAIDAEAADVIIQYALFGEVYYG